MPVNPTRILHLISSMNPDDGGPPEAVRQLAQASKDMGDSVEIVCQDDPSANFLQFLPCPVHAIGRGAGKYGYSQRLLKWLRENISRFDRLVIHGIWQYIDVAGWKAAQGRVPYVVFVHGALDPWFKERYPLKHLKKYLYWPLQYVVLRRAKAVLFTGESERNLAATSFSPNQWTDRIVPFGTSAPQGDRQAQIEAFYKLMPSLRGRRYLLFIARIHEKKGCDLLIQAYAKLARQHEDVDLVVAGPDQVGLQSQLQALAEGAGIANRIHWPGMITGDAKYGAFYAAEAFILPSHQENFGVAVAEALACGKPVLISNKVEIWKDIEQESVGFVEDDTLEGTERLLQKWFALDAASRAAMIARTIPCFEKHYSIRNTVLAIDRIFREAS